ncbi:MAG: hypothetical protein ACLSS0_13545 [Clostridioides difficile]
MLTDGRDIDPQSGLSYAKEIEACMAETGRSIRNCKWKILCNG